MVGLDNEAERMRNGSHWIPVQKRAYPVTIAGRGETIK